MEYLLFYRDRGGLQPIRGMRLSATTSGSGITVKKLLSGAPGSVTISSVMTTYGWTTLHFRVEYADGSVDYIFAGGTVWGTFNPSYTTPVDKVPVALYIWAAASWAFPPIQVDIGQVSVTPVSASQAVGSPAYGFTGEWWESDLDLLHLRARWYLPETGTFLSRDPVESEPPYLYVRGNPVNRIDPTGLSWQHPTGPEGVTIHTLVENDYRLRAEALGRVVGTEVKIAGADKEDSDLWWEGELAQRIPLPDINDPQPGRADIVDFTLQSVYDIKHYPSRAVGLADAIWYRNHLNADPNYRNFGPWKIGGPEGYPGPFLIGDWPGDPDAYLFASYTMPGVITYWGVAKPKKVLEWCLTAAAILILKKAPSKVPVPGGIRPIPVPAPSGPPQFQHLLRRRPVIVSVGSSDLWLKFILSVLS